MTRTLTQVLQVWWTKDRIRVARSEGKLWRISVGDRLLVDNQLFQVLSRSESDSLAVPEVIYTLAKDDGGSAELWHLSSAKRTERAKLRQASEAW